MTELLLVAQFGGRDLLRMQFVALVLPLIAALLFGFSGFLRFKATRG